LLYCLSISGKSFPNWIRYSYFAIQSSKKAKSSISSSCISFIVIFLLCVAGDRWPVISELYKHCRCLFHSLHQCINFCFCVVQADRCPDRARYPEAIHQRLGAMMPGTYGNSQFVQDHAYVIWMDAFKQERNNT